MSSSFKICRRIGKWFVIASAIAFILLTILVCCGCTADHRAAVRTLRQPSFPISHLPSPISAAPAAHPAALIRAAQDEDMAEQILRGKRSTEDGKRQSSD